VIDSVYVHISSGEFSEAAAIAERESNRSL